jgi:hypothetical protein
MQEKNNVRKKKDCTLIALKFSGMYSIASILAGVGRFGEMGRRSIAGKKALFCKSRKQGTLRVELKGWIQMGLEIL